MSAAAEIKNADPRGRLDVAAVKVCELMARRFERETGFAVWPLFEEPVAEWAARHLRPRPTRASSRRKARR